MVLVEPRCHCRPVAPIAEEWRFLEDTCSPAPAAEVAAISPARRDDGSSLHRSGTACPFRAQVSMTAYEAGGAAGASLAINPGLGEAQS
jgi:hypothetical protein